MVGTENALNMTPGFKKVIAIVLVTVCYIYWSYMSSSFLLGSQPLNSLSMKCWFGVSCGRRKHLRFHFLKQLFHWWLSVTLFTNIQVYMKMNDDIRLANQPLLRVSESFHRWARQQRVNRVWVCVWVTVAFCGALSEHRVHVMIVHHCMHVHKHLFHYLMYWRIKQIVSWKPSPQTGR